MEKNVKLLSTKVISLEKKVSKRVTKKNKNKKKKKKNKKKTPLIKRRHKLISHYAVGAHPKQ